MVVVIFAAVVGIMLGVLGGGVFVLVPWTIAGFVVGHLSKTRNESFAGGFVFGFILSFLFMIHGYRGNTPIIHAIPLFIGLGIFGGICGVTLSLISFSLKFRFRK